ncbi:uncharacterized protein FSUBG_8961 [Fusarium subglutinans]|uniref:Uncharacterized protein n=1 Tax=Gibberella subglutinans TaxID=42677 RepID=A0A8H5PFS0_GIBSU|nr:uncharacterized protein FSUBG_8961 [Fusarium subglutinans]KAF5596051.1 hypothetical protein FSUBG_8961 [Fusarium subglutinans]
MLISHPQQTPHTFAINTKPYPTNTSLLNLYIHKFKMSSAPGFIKSNGSGKFTAEFAIDDGVYILSGTVNPPTQPFQSNSATLEYSSVDNLQGPQQFTGIIGSRNEASFTFSDGTAIKGPLDIPVNPASQVSGMGFWSQG